MKRIAAIAAAWLLFGLFTRSQAAAEGAIQAARICVDVLLPSLFPFLAIALFAQKSGAGGVFSCLLSPLTRVLRLPRDCGGLLLFSLCGGYPTGARLLASAVSEGRVSRKDAARLLGFCVAPGPAFVVLAVGKGMFRSAAVGYILLTSQLAASLLCGVWLCRRGSAIEMRPARPMPIGAALAEAVSQASGGVLSIFSWVILCGALLPLLPFANGSGLAAALCEVTNGCRIASRLSGMRGVCFASFLLAFGGAGVLCQIAAIASEENLPLRGFLRRRIACGCVSAGLTALLLRVFPQTAAVWADAAEPMLFSSANRMIGAICLCAMIGMTLSNISERKTVDFSRRM